MCQNLNITLPVLYLLQLKSTVDDKVKFLKDIRSKITDTEVHIYETMGVESRNKRGRSDAGMSTDVQVLFIYDNANCHLVISFISYN